MATNATSGTVEWGDESDAQSRKDLNPDELKALSEVLDNEPIEVRAYKSRWHTSITFTLKFDNYERFSEDMLPPEWCLKSVTVKNGAGKGHLEIRIQRSN